MPYRKNTAGRAANQCTTITLPRGRANGPGPARAWGKAAPFETSSPKSAKQIVRRMRHPPARITYGRVALDATIGQPREIDLRGIKSWLAERARVPHSIVPLTPFVTLAPFGYGKPGRKETGANVANPFPVGAERTIRPVFFNSLRTVSESRDSFSCHLPLR
jgi:hypothetical protein